MEAGARVATFRSGHRVRQELSVSEQIRRIPAAVRATVQAARRTVRSAAPEAEERAYASQPPGSSRSMWKIARYRAEDADVVGIGTYPDHATLFFHRGRELDDGSGLLEGGGKTMRYVTLRAPSDARRPAVARLVRRAFRLGGAGDLPRADGR